MTQQEEARVREIVIAVVREIGRVNGTSQVPQINTLPSSEEQKLYSLPAVVMNQMEDGFESYVAIKLNLLWDETKEVTGEAREAMEAANNAAESVIEAIRDAQRATSEADEAASNTNTSRLQIESNESQRQSNESQRQSNESTRNTNEQTRQGNESGRVTAESGRVTEEGNRVNAETARANAESGRVDAEESREQQATSDHNRAETDHGISVSDHSTASADHSTAESDHSTAESDHSTASSDHNIATSDHSTADSDHSIAESDHSIAESDHSTASDDHDIADHDHTLADHDHTLASQDHTLASQDHTQAGTDHTQAGTDHQNAVEATEDAEKVNAQISGMTVTITNRNGVATSVNIGFEIDEENVFESRAEMLAAASRVAKGKFCMIANNDPNDDDNATLWTRNSRAANDNPYTFLSDLDQASAAAYKDWLDNKKPEIENATLAANTAASNANTKAGLADTIYNTVRSWFNGENNNGFKATTEAWIAATKTAWDNWYSDSLATGVRKLWNDFWSNINSRWENFFGEESGTPTKGVQKIWIDWFTARITEWSSYKDAKDADWTSYKSSKDTNWNDYKSSKNTDWDGYKSSKDTDWTNYKNGKSTIWDGWFGTDDTSGVQKQWKDTKTDAVLATNNANEKASYAKQEGDRCKDLNDHPQEIRSDGYIWAWDEESEEMVNTLRRIIATLDVSSLTEEQKQEIINMFALDLASTVEAAGVANGTLTIDDNNKDKVISIAALKAYRDVIKGIIFATDEEAENIWKDYQFVTTD